MKMVLFPDKYWKLSAPYKLWALISPIRVSYFLHLGYGFSSALNAILQESPSWGTNDLELDDLGFQYLPLPEILVVASIICCGLDYLFGAAAFG